MARQNITTAIDYPNAPPHMGHVLEKVLADVMVRWFRLRGDEVRFQIGADEHGIKIQRTAEKEDITPQMLVNRNVPLFQGLYDQLNISYDVFLRTSDQEKHWPTVRALWKKLQEAGALEKRSYRGLYCSGCERFVTKKDLVDGNCPDHQVPPEEIREENWFFLLKREGAWLKELLTKEEGYRIVPDFRARETLSLIEQGLEDVSFSRPRSSLSWGVPVPGDEQQTMYVWCDALTNYISSLGYFTNREESKWWDEAKVTHVIGKDIARFHALIWPAMLKAASVRTPDRLLIHGFLTSEGQKMSKSLGNVVVPGDVVEKYGVDPLRFYLSHEIPVGRDGDFSWKRFAEIYDAKLRNQLGNLLQRVIVLLNKDSGVLSVPSKDLWDTGRWNMFCQSMNAFDISIALQGTMRIVETCNIFINTMEPWKKSGAEKAEILGALAELLRHIALMLLPFMPETAQRMAKQLNLPCAGRMLEKGFVITEQMRQWGGEKDWKQVGSPMILFPPIV